MAEGGVLSIRTAHQREVRKPTGTQGTATGGFVTISVRDTGTGMDPETVARAFEPFFTRKATGQGSGLGLATVEGIVSQSGGRIAVESQVGRGSTFTVYLPREPEAEPLAATPAAHSPSTGGGGTVLLVEDEDMVRNLTRRVLRAAGYVVLEAENGEAALRLYEECGGGIDLLLTDAVMPRMGGKALAKTLRERDGELPIIIMSGYSGDVVGGDTTLPDGVAFLQKPFVPKALGALVAAEMLRNAHRPAAPAGAPGPG